jgi:diguanylate cyclase (GGDEF)-like protein
MRIGRARPTRFAASTGDAVRPAAIGLTLIYLFVALPPALALPPPQRAVLASTMIAAAGVSALIGWSTVLVRGDLAAVVHWFLAGLAGVPTVTSLISMVVLAKPFESVNLMLTLIGATAVIHVRRAAVIVGVSVVGSWLVVGLVVVPAVITAETLSAMGSATVVAVILHVARQRTVARLDSAREQIAVMAVTDELTGLGNRRLLMERGPGVLLAARATGRDVTLLYLDVDGLKRVNDSQGHLAGDRLIADVGAALRSVFRDADIVARCGGDEFAVLMAGCGPGAVAPLTQRLSTVLASVGAAASVGMAHAPADQEVSLDTLLDEADRTMYLTKHARRVRPHTKVEVPARG